MNTVERSNEAMVIESVKKKFETKPRKAGGFYILGKEREVNEFLDRLIDLVNLDCPSIIGFRSAPIFDPNGSGKQVGIAFVNFIHDRSQLN